MKPTHSLRNFLAGTGLALVCVSFASAADGVFSASGNLGGGDQDANVGLLSSETYLNAVNIEGGALTINGVSFEGSSGANPSGTNYSITNVPSTLGAGGTNSVGGNLGSLLNGFIYGGNPETLTLNGLTAGQTYSLALYNRSWSGPGGRTQSITTTGGASTTFDQDFNPAGSLNILRYTFTASGASEAINFAHTGASFHIYGFATEQVFNKTWTSGADWTTATWSSAGDPNGVGSNADFTAQGSPTSINLDANRTVGHIRYDGANTWTVSGANTLTLQADVGGVSVLGAASGTHTISTAVNLNSGLLKTGDGTVVLSGAVSDYGKGITIGDGTLEFGNGSNQYLSSVISGSGNLAKSGSGTLSIGAAASYTGDTIINGGTLKLQAPSTIGTSSFTTSDSPAGSFTPASNNLILNANPSANVGAGAPEGTGTTASLTNGTAGTGSANAYTVNNFQSITYTLPTVTGGGGQDLSAINLYSTWNDEGRDRITISSIQYSTISDPGNFITISNSGVNFDGSSVDLLAALNATGGVLASNAHSVRINFDWQENNYAGYREIEVVGTATSAAAGTGGSNLLPTGTDLQIGASGTLDLNGNAQTVASLSGAGTVANGAATAASLTVNQSINTTFSGGISGNTSLTKDGSGTLTLSGSSSYSGATSVSAGTLYVTGALSGSAVTVGANGTVGSNGAAGALGNGLTLNAGANLDLTGATIALNSSGILSLTGGSLTLGNLTFQDLVGWDWANAAVGTYELIDGTFSINWGSTAYLSEATAYDFGNGKKGYFTSGSLNVVVIPEPRAALLGGLGLLMLLRRRR